ncbi:MAG: ABC transporter substrate-binding protein, partial [Lachnospiraceae bacterium]|nr:ABC transporter substrate-binding protein [Lachnospiraceae bacterium]
MKNKATKVFAAIIAVLTTMALLAGCQTGGSNEGKTYKIGATGPLTGGASSYGISVNNGAALAVEEINAAGGLNGVKFSFDMKDDEADPEKVASGYDALFDSGMQISLGSVTSGACNAFGKRAAEDKVFFMTPSASAASVIATGPNAFRVCFGDPDQGVLAAQELTKKYQKIGCIYDTSDTYSTGIYAAFEEEMKNLNAEFEVRTFDADNKKDFSSQVEALKDCEVIFCPFYYTEASLVARACAA